MISIFRTVRPTKSVSTTLTTKSIFPLSQRHIFQRFTSTMEYTRQAGPTICLIWVWKADRDPRLGDSGLKISKVILGAMSYGSPEWQEWVLDEEKSLPLLEHAYKVGLNTWDTVCILPISVWLCFQLLTWIQGRRLLQWQIGRDRR